MATARSLLMPALGRCRLLGPLALLCLLTGCRLSSTQVGKASAQPNSLNQSAPYFVDAAASSGLNYRWVIPGKRPLTILQTIGNGCAFLDYDNDGSLDALLVGTDHVALYKGDGRGHFADVSRQTGLDTLRGHFLGVAVGDYDNDGYDDLYISGYGTGRLLHNEGGRGFRDVTAASGLKPQPWGSSAAWGDVDGDGKLDLYVCNYVKFGPDTKPQLCEVNGKMTGCGPRLYAGASGVLYRSLGWGKFQDITQPWGASHVSGYGLGAAFADYNGSGRQSLAVAVDESPGDLLLNRGGTFQNVGRQSGTALDAGGNVHGGMGIDWGDYDNDGKLDLFVATYQHQDKCVYHNEGGYFNESSAGLGLTDAAGDVTFGGKWLDYDNDGWLDLIMTNGHVQDNIHDVDQSTTYRQPILLFHNRLGAGFEDVSPRLDAQAARPIVGRGLAIGDYDNDGRLDVLAVDSEGAPLLLHNQTPGAGHWLTLALQGVKSNRDGLGAIVTVEAGGTTETRLCQTDGSYLSASDRRVHLGLGAALTADSLAVLWPSGHRDTFKNVAADRVLTLREGSTLTNGRAWNVSRP